MKKTYSILTSFFLGFVAVLSLFSCESGKSYSELLNEENRAVNRFLVDQQVIPYIPADSVFEYGPDAPFYQIDGEGNIYMQVIDPGSGPKATDDQLVYFRFLRYALTYYNGSLKDLPSEGNQNDLTQAPTSFRFQNYTLQSSSQWGSGIQLPLEFLPLNCEVNLVVKSQFGWTSEISYVVPYYYHIRYYKSQI